MAPSGLTATGDSVAGTVSLAWTDGSNNEDGFIVQRQVDSGAWDNSYDTVGANVIAYLDDNHGGGRLPDATYTYRVVASNGNGRNRSAPAASISARPSASSVKRSSISATVAAAPAGNEHTR